MFLQPVAASSRGIQTASRVNISEYFTSRVPAPLLKTKVSSRTRTRQTPLAHWPQSHFVQEVDHSPRVCQECPHLCVLWSIEMAPVHPSMFLFKKMLESADICESVLWLCSLVRTVNIQSRARRGDAQEMKCFSFFERRCSIRVAVGNFTLISSCCMWKLTSC